MVSIMKMYACSRTIRMEDRPAQVEDTAEKVP
jgi:hypothetical protein